MQLQSRSSISRIVVCFVVETKMSCYVRRITSTNLQITIFLFYDHTFSLGVEYLRLPIILSMRWKLIFVTNKLFPHFHWQVCKNRHICLRRQLRMTRVILCNQFFTKTCGGRVCVCVRVSWQSVCVRDSRMQNSLQFVQRCSRPSVHPSALETNPFMIEQ